MKFGVCTSFRNYEALCNIGFDYIELAGTELAGMDMDAVKAFAESINARQVPCIGLNSYCGASVPIVGEGYSRETAIAYAEDICRKASLLGVMNIGIGSPAARMLPQGYDMQLADEQCRDFLRSTARVAADYGMTVLLESLCTLMCDYLVHTEDAVKIVSELQQDVPNIAMVLDFYQMSMMKEDITDIAYVMPYVRHLHINSFDEKGSRLYLRSNQADYVSRAIMSAKKCGYDGTMSVEAQTDDFVTDAVESLRILRMASEK